MSGSRKKKKRTASGKSSGRMERQNRGQVRLVLCAAVFVLLVAAKLLFPQTLWRITRTAAELLGTDTDFQTVFAAVGRAVSGESEVADSLQQAYQAVFHPFEDVPDVRAERSAAEGYDYLRPHARYEKFLRVQVPLPAQSEAAEPTEASSSAAPAGAALPVNASLELRNPGFSYVSPVVGSLTSCFGWRDHPVSGEEKFHYGVDLAAEEGSAICAFADGEVYAAGESSSLGRYVMIRHANNYMTLYAHCSRVTVSGGEVKMGQKIAEVGQTGVATGPHLHFELRCGSLYLNPLYYVQLL